MPQPSQEQLQSVYDKVVKTYSHRENVTGVDVGFRYDQGKRTNEMAVRIHVKEKIPEEALEADEIFPRKIDEVPIDVIQAVYTPHPSTAAIEPEADTVDRRTRFDILRPGISVGHEGITAGTLGAVVFDRQTSARGILSNWHVLAGSSDATPGDPIVQPGPKHGGRAPQDTVARLERFLLNSFGDAAFAILNARRGIDDTQLETNVRITSARRVQMGDIVMKSGRATGITRGLVDGIGQYTLSYSVGSRTISGFKIVPELDGNPNDEEVSAGGDSGSVWFSVADQSGLGLHFAGETDSAPNQEHALACHLNDVLEQLDVTLLPTGTVPPAPPEPEMIELGDIGRTGGESDVTRLLIDSLARLIRVLEKTSTGSVPGSPAVANGARVAPRKRRTNKR